MRQINLIILHCSAASIPNQTAAMIRQWHTMPPPKGRGWSDIGYHWFIRTCGLTEPGRPIEEIGAHCEGHNHDSIGICLAGLLPSDFTEAQFNALRALLADLRARFPTATTHPHHEFNHGKACPVYDVTPFV